LPWQQLFPNYRKSPVHGVFAQYQEVVLVWTQDEAVCAAVVGFVATAAAEAAINVYLQQSWSRLSLSEQDFSFCK
jgi:hypothetical protein